MLLRVMDAAAALWRAKGALSGKKCAICESYILEPLPRGRLVPWQSQQTGNLRLAIAVGGACHKIGLAYRAILATCEDLALLAT